MNKISYPHWKNKKKSHPHPKPLKKVKYNLKNSHKIYNIVLIIFVGLFLWKEFNFNKNIFIILKFRKDTFTNSNEVTSYLKSFFFNFQKSVLAVRQLILH